eukprot:7890088-Alexandrium_andersonii.AAC.1
MASHPQRAVQHRHACAVCKRACARARPPPSARASDPGASSWSTFQVVQSPVEASSGDRPKRRSLRGKGSSQPGLHGSRPMSNGSPNSFNAAYICPTSLQAVLGPPGRIWPAFCVFWRSSQAQALSGFARKPLTPSSTA